MVSEHNEIEAKLDADFVEIEDFCKFIKGTYDVTKHVEILSPDGYYESGAAVVRQRGDIDDPHHELTVKLRKSTGSTRDRVEIDLKFAEKTTAADVRAFLESTGFKHVFTLIKKAYIFWVKLTPSVHASFVIYDVWRSTEARGFARRFVEVEVEKGSDVTPETAKRHVREQVKQLQTRFNLSAPPLNESLYEIYSGKRYQVVDSL